MWWFLSLTLALLANPGQGSVLLDWTVATKAVVDMTEADVAQLAGAIDIAINKAGAGPAGLACMARAKATITFGLIFPRITMAPAAIIEEVVASAAVPVPVAVQNKLPHLVTWIVHKVISPIHDMPEVKPVIAAGGVVAAIVDQLVKDIKVPTVVVTGGDVIARVHKIIGILKGKSCDQLVSEAQLITFVNTAAALLDGGDVVALKPVLVDGIVAKIVGFVNDAAVARQLAVTVVETAEVVVEDIKVKTDAMAAAFIGGKIPVAFFVKALIKMAGAVPGIAGNKGFGAAMNFPAATDACYEQKLAIYNAVLLRVFTGLQKAVVKGAVAGLVADTAVIDAFFMPVDDAIVGVIDGLKAHHLTHVVGILMGKSGWLWETLVGLKKAGRVDMVTAAAAINKLMIAVDSRVICAVNPVVANAIVTGAYQKVAKIFDANIVVAMEKKIRQVANGYTVVKVVAKVTPVIHTFKTAFEAMHADFLTQSFSIGPVAAIVGIIADAPMAGFGKGVMGAGIGVMGAGIGKGVVIDPDVVIKAVLAELRMTGEETLMDVADIQLHQVIAKITAAMEQHIPAACRAKVALIVAKGLIVTVVKQRAMKAMETAVYLIERDVQPANVAVVKDAIMKNVNQWIAAFVAEIPAIRVGDIAIADEVGMMLDVVGMEKMKLVDVLNMIVVKAAKVIGTEIAMCDQPGNIHSWNAFMQIVVQHLVKRSQEAALIGGIPAAVVGGDWIKVQKCQAIIGAVCGNVFAELITAVSAIADVAQPQIVRRMVIDLIIKNIRVVTFPAFVHLPAGAFKNPFLTQIVTKYSQILAHLLGGMTAQPVAGAAIEQILHQVVAKIATGAAYNAGLEGFHVQKLIAHLTEVLKGAHMAAGPNDVIVNTVITVTHHIMNTVPQDCLVPVMAKVMAAFVILHTEIMDIMPEHPVMATLAAIIQAADPAGALTLDKVVAVVKAVIGQIKVTAAMAAEGLAIFNNVDVVAVKDVLAMVIAPIQAGETAAARFQRVWPHLEMIVNKPGVCEPIAIAAVMEEAKQYMTRIMEAPALTRVELGGVLAAVIPEDGVREVVVDVIAARALPVVWAGFKDVIHVAGIAIENPGAFPQLFTHIIVKTLGLDAGPVARILRSPVYVLVLEAIKTELIAHLMPFSTVPAETLAIRIGEAFVRTVDIIGILPKAMVPLILPVVAPAHPIMTQLAIAIHVAA